MKLCSIQYDIEKGRKSAWLWLHKHRIIHVLKWWTISALTRGLFWCLFPKFRSYQGNKHQNNTWVSAETVCHVSIYIILLLTQHNESINDDKNDKLYTSSPCLTRSVFILLMTSQSIVDDVRTTRQLWRDHFHSSLWDVWLSIQEKLNILTLNVWGPSYLGSTRSIS